MIAILLDGTSRLFKPGSAICGVGFKQVTLDFDDCRPEHRDWLNLTLSTRFTEVEIDPRKINNAGFGLTPIANEGAPIHPDASVIRTELLSDNEYQSMLSAYRTYYGDEVADKTMQSVKRVGMTKNEMIDALRDIGLALSLTHNTVTTDIVGVEPDKTSWRIDHSKELKKLNALENAINAPWCVGEN